MKKILLLSIVFATVMLGCKKEDDDDASTPASKSSMLTGTWKVTAATVSPPIDFFGTQISDIYNSIFYQDCNKDDLFIFKSDKTYEFNEGNSKCDPSDPQIQEVGTWKFNTDETLLILTEDGGTSTETKFENFTSKTITIVETEFDSTTAVLYTFKQTMTKQ